jgi:hypothetical protein
VAGGPPPGVGCFCIRPPEPLPVSWRRAALLLAGVSAGRLLRILVGGLG